MITQFFIFAAVFIVFSYVVFRKVVRRDYLQRQKLSPLSYILETLVFAGHVNALYLILPTPWPGMPELPDDPMVTLVAGGLFSLGLILLLIAWFGLGTKTSFGQDKNKLQTGGLYHYSRNPQLVAYGIFLTSLVILFFSWLSVVWFALYIVASYFMVQSEEEFLAQQYGAEYETYCQAVPRIV